MTKIGIISDTHDVLRPQFLEELKKCDVIVHAGDMANEGILDKIRLLGQPIYAVRGNCDSWWASFLHPVQRFRIEGLQFVLVHQPENAYAYLEGADVVIFGHTHQFCEQKKDGILWLNPGSASLPRYGADKSMVIMEVDDTKYTVKRLDFDIL